MNFFSFQMGSISVLLETLPKREKCSIEIDNGEIHIYWGKIFIIFSLIRNQKRKW